MLRAWRDPPKSVGGKPNAQAAKPRAKQSSPVSANKARLVRESPTLRSLPKVNMCTARLVLHGLLEGAADGDQK
jgi:hypothetical protein